MTARESRMGDDSPTRAKDAAWQLDVTFLLSSWQCIFGDGCQGVLDRAGTRAGARVAAPTARTSPTRRTATTS